MLRRRRAARSIDPFEFFDRENGERQETAVAVPLREEGNVFVKVRALPLQKSGLLQRRSSGWPAFDRLMPGEVHPPAWRFLRFSSLHGPDYGTSRSE